MTLHRVYCAFCALGMVTEQDTFEVVCEMCSAALERRMQALRAHCSRVARASPTSDRDDIANAILAIRFEDVRLEDA